MSSGMSTSRRNPKPGKLVMVHDRGDPIYVMVGPYRLRKRRYREWVLQFADGDGWGEPMEFRTRKAAERAIHEHLTGSAEMTIPQRVAALENAVSAFEESIRAT